MKRCTLGIGFLIVRKSSTILFILLAFLCASCKVSQRVDAAKAAVEHLHQQLDSGQFEAMYEEADSRFTSATTQQQFVDLMAAVHRKLGNVTSADVTNWKVNANTAGTFVTLSYKTQFGAEQVTETFQFRESEGKERLVSYNINSTALITK
jgi:hypothetical protein